MKNSNVFNPTLVFRDGKLFTYRIKEDGMIEYIDVTEQIAKTIAKHIL